MDEKLVRQTFAGVVGMVMLIALAAASGVLPWALFVGLGASLAVGVISRKLIASLIAGAIVTAVVSAFGIASMLSPGWYEGLR